MANQLQIQQVVPYTPNGGGNLSIERQDGMWSISDAEVRYIANISHKDIRKVKRAIYTYITYVRRYATSLDNASSLYFDFDAPSYNDL